MKRAVSMILALVLCLSLCACGSTNDNLETTQVIIPETTVAYIPEPRRPTIESVVQGIKYEFKDPSSVMISEGTWAYVEVNGEEVTDEFYIICTVHAKNGFGGYADPQAYIVRYRYGSYKIIGEYNDASYNRQLKFNELGCGAGRYLK